MQAAKQARETCQQGGSTALCHVHQAFALSVSFREHRASLGIAYYSFGPCPSVASFRSITYLQVHPSYPACLRVRALHVNMPRQALLVLYCPHLVLKHVLQRQGVIVLAPGLFALDMQPINIELLLGFFERVVAARCS